MLEKELASGHRALKHSHPALLSFLEASTYPPSPSSAHYPLHQTSASPHYWPTVELQTRGKGSMQLNYMKR